MKKWMVLFAGIPLLAACSRDAMPFDDFARCLKAKNIVMYGSDTCPHCTEQKASFQGSFDLVSYVECNRQAAECQKAGIQAYPTWKIDGKMYEGRKSLSDLSEMSGCPLTASEPAGE